MALPDQKINAFENNLSELSHFSTFGRLNFETLKIYIMKNFLVTYHSTPESMEAMASATPEQMADGMKPWLEWQERVGSSLVEMGSPLCASQKLTASSTDGACSNSVTGYSIIQADDMAGAKKVLENHPHLGWDNGAWVEVHESMAM